MSNIVETVETEASKLFKEFEAELGSLWKLVDGKPTLHNEDGTVKSPNPADHERWLTAHVANIKAAAPAAVVEPVAVETKPAA